MKNVTEYWDQVKALRRMREKPSPLGFQKAQFHPGRKKLVTVRRSPYNKDAHPGLKVQKSQLTGIKDPPYCVDLVDICLLTLKPASFYNIEKHVNCTLILKVNHVCCTHITDCGLNAYQRIKAPFTHETKAYK